MKTLSEIGKAVEKLSSAQKQALIEFLSALFHRESKGPTRRDFAPAERDRARNSKSITRTASGPRYPGCTGANAPLSASFPLQRFPGYQEAADSSIDGAAIQGFCSPTSYMQDAMEKPTTSSRFSFAQHRVQMPGKIWSRWLDTA
jgi:hypothetical protein